jgi:hypothetical protein
MRIVWGILRIALAIATVAAIIGQLIVSTNNWHSLGITDTTIQVTNFFSFFTIESNVLTVVVMLTGAWFLFTRTGADPTWQLGLRLATVTYMTTTGVVYNLLLRGVELPQGTTLPWSNEVLHLVGPLFVLIDWFVAPGRRPIAWRSLWPVLIFPIVWGVYTLIRGPITYDAVFKKPYWYPYPFLNPNTSPEGYASVVFYIVLIAVVIGAVCAGAIWVSKRSKLLATSAL